MTDTPEQDPPLSAAQEAVIRRALANAGGPEPMPEEVADRLDRVITGLAAERADAVATIADPATHERAVVVPMDAAARRRRMRVRVLLAAASVVVAGGLAAGIVGGTDGGDDAMQTSRAEGPARGDAGGAVADEPGGVDSGAAGPESAGAPGTTAPLKSRRVVIDEPLPVVRADRLRSGLTKLQATLPAKVDYGRSVLRAPRDFVCEGAGLGAGFLLGVEYDARAAVVAFREPVGTSQVAEVIACGTSDVLHSTTLSAR